MIDQCVRAGFIHENQKDEVFNERWLPISSFDVKQSWSEAERAFDCHILTPSNSNEAEYSIQGGNTDK